MPQIDGYPAIRNGYPNMDSRFSILPNLKSYFSEVSLQFITEFSLPQSFKLFYNQESSFFFNKPV